MSEMSCSTCRSLQGETVHISLPSLPQFVSLARLTVASVGNIVGFSIDVVAVSYTHLAVYKRQSWSRAGAFQKRP